MNKIKSTEISSDDSDIQHESVQYNLILFLESLKKGSIGFALVFSLVMTTKFMSFSISASNSFSIELNDLIISFWGFIIFSFIVLSQKFRSR